MCIYFSAAPGVPCAFGTCIIPYFGRDLGDEQPSEQPGLPFLSFTLSIYADMGRGNDR